MNAPQEHQEHQGQHQRREGLGGRMRRFVDTELNRVFDKEDRGSQPRTGHPGSPDPADRAEVVDRGYEPVPAYEPPAQEMPAHEVPTYQPPQAHDTDQTTYPDPANVPTSEAGPADEPVGDQAGAARVGLLNDVSGLRDEWQRVQGTFVDDPQRAVREASALVERTLEEIRTNVGSKRPSETMSTEDLRVSFQRYREFFQRLLAA